MEQHENNGFGSKHDYQPMARPQEWIRPMGRTHQIYCNRSLNMKNIMELLDWKFEWKYMVRGLVLAKKRGNILEMDRHKYVRVAYHGFRKMSREDRQAAYGSNLSLESFEGPDYALTDALQKLISLHRLSS